MNNGYKVLSIVFGSILIVFLFMVIMMTVFSRGMMGSNGNGYGRNCGYDEKPGYDYRDNNSGRGSMMYVD